MKCPHCTNGQVVLFTSTTTCEHCNGIGQLPEHRGGLIPGINDTVPVLLSPGNCASGHQEKLAALNYPTPHWRQMSGDKEAAPVFNEEADVNTGPYQKIAEWWTKNKDVTHFRIDDGEGNHVDVVADDVDIDEHYSHRSNIKMVPISEIKYNSGRALNPRIMHPLIDGVKANGILTPLVIDSDNNLINGYHRLCAAQAANLTEVPCTVSDECCLESENYSPLTEKQKLLLLTRFGQPGETFDQMQARIVGTIRDIRPKGEPIRKSAIFDPIFVETVKVTGEIVDGRARLEATLAAGDPEYVLKDKERVPGIEPLLQAEYRRWYNPKVGEPGLSCNPPKESTGCVEVNIDPEELDKSIKEVFDKMKKVFKSR